MSPLPGDSPIKADGVVDGTCLLRLDIGAGGKIELVDEKTGQAGVGVVVHKPRGAGSGRRADGGVIRREDRVCCLIGDGAMGSKRDSRGGDDSSHEGAGASARLT